MVRLLQDPATGAAVAGAGERPADGPGIARDAWHWHTPPDTYAAQVGILREWIAAGDLFQANLTACCESLRPEPPDPLALYGRLVSHGPAPFAGLAVAGGEAVISASPERFLRLHPNGQVETRPIKGTRPRRADPDADAASAAELICDPKDRAENVMIVDLLRNDLGRVCVPGSVHVPQLLGLESYAHVHHLTSVVMGRLADGRGLVDLLRACWPGAPSPAPPRCGPASASTSWSRCRGALLRLPLPPGRRRQLRQQHPHPHPAAEGPAPAPPCRRWHRG